MRFFYYDNFTFEQLVHASSFHSAHSCTSNVCDNNVYEAQTCASFYQLIVLISVQDDGTVEVLRRVNYLSQEGLQQTIYLLMLQSKPVKRFNKTTAFHNMHQVHSNFHVFIFCVLFYSYTRLINLKILLYVTFLTIKFSRSMIHCHYSVQHIRV